MNDNYTFIPNAFSIVTTFGFLVAARLAELDRPFLPTDTHFEFLTHRSILKDG